MKPLVLSGSLDDIQPRVAPVYITKYNRYVDSILEKINKILRNGYDPVSVRLHSVKSNKKNEKKENTKNSKDSKKKESERQLSATTDIR